MALWTEERKRELLTIDTDKEMFTGLRKEMSHPYWLESWSKGKLFTLLWIKHGIKNDLPLLEVSQVHWWRRKFLPVPKLVGIMELASYCVCMCPDWLSPGIGLGVLPGIVRPFLCLCTSEAVSRVHGFYPGYAQLVTHMLQYPGYAQLSHARYNTLAMPN